MFVLAVLNHCSKPPFPMGRVRFHVFKFCYSLYSNDFTSDQNRTDEDPLGRKIFSKNLNTQTLVQKWKPKFDNQ